MVQSWTMCHGSLETHCGMWEGGHHLWGKAHQEMFHLSLNLVKPQKLVGVVVGGQI